MQGGYQRSVRASAHENASRDSDVQLARKSATEEEETSSTLYPTRVSELTRSPGSLQPGLTTLALCVRFFVCHIL